MRKRITQNPTAKPVSNFPLSDEEFREFIACLERDPERNPKLAKRVISESEFFGHDFESEPLNE